LNFESTNFRVYVNFIKLKLIVIYVLYLHSVRICSDIASSKSYYTIFTVQLELSKH